MIKLLASAYLVLSLSFLTLSVGLIYIVYLSIKTGYLNEINIYVAIWCICVWVCNSIASFIIWKNRYA